MGVPPLPENRILKPRDKTIHDSNHWPEFPLTQVEIRDGNTGEPASLLSAEAGSPVTIVGKLDSLSKDRAQYLRNKVSPPVMIEITNVELYSYGQYEEGEVALWAAGEAGWYEIKPSRSYRVIFKDMVQAVKLLYFAADFYRELDRYKIRKIPVDELYEQYAAEPSHKCQNAVDAAKIFHQQKQFLVNSMENGKEGIAWKQTQIYQDLIRESPEPEDSDSVTSVEAAIDVTPPRRLPHAGKSKSILRPRSEKHSMKGAGRRQSPGPSEEVDEGAGEAEEPTLNGNHYHNEQMTLIPQLKRKDYPSQRGGRSGRRHKQNPASSKEVNDFSPSEVFEAAEVYERPLPLRSSPRPPTSKPANIVHIIESPLPSYEPQGPGDTWTCTFDGCIHRVYAASEPESRDLIKQHYRSHALSTQAQIDLIYKEERPYLPVGNLIKKIREMAAQQNAADSAKAGAEAMVGWPKPMERKY